MTRDSSSGVLTIAARKFADYGKWTSLVSGIKPGQAYRFGVLYRAKSVRSEETSVVAILSWFKDAEATSPVQRDFAETMNREGEWRRIGRTLTAPAGASTLRIELALRWSEQGIVEWKNPEIAEVSAPRHRLVRLVTTHLQPPSGSSVEKNLQLMSDIIDKAAAKKPDLVVLSENVVDRNTGKPIEETSQTIPGPATEMLANKAKQHKTYIATSLHEREGDILYNTAILIDRGGRIVGKYRKVHLAMEEGERGITPGNEYPVFDTDFGKVGLLVCWDNWFVETARILRLKGAELLVLPIAGDGAPGHWDVISRARAIDNGVFLVSSNTVGESTSRIVSPEGKILAETLEPEGIAAAEVDLDAVERVRWLSVGPADGDPRNLYVKERRPETYQALHGGAASASIDFEGGSGGISKLSDNHFRCDIHAEADQDKRNHQPSWFYFHIDGIRGQELTVDLAGFRGEYNYKPTDGRWARNLRPAISFDNKTWHFAQDVEFDEAEPRLRLHLRPEGDRIWIARIPPYVNTHLGALLESIKGHPHLKQTSIGTTPEGRSIPLLTITNPLLPLQDKKVVWLMARQHSWEAGTSWVAEGAIRFLLSDTPETARLRNRFVFQILPMCDPDGVARGGVRFNRNGYDLNRNWDNVDPALMPEIAAERRALLDWVDSGNRIDFFMTIHNTESEDYIQGPMSAGGPGVVALMKRLSDSLASETTFHAPKGPRDMTATTTPGMKGRMTVNQNLFHERKVTALLMELMTDKNPRLGRELTIDDRLTFGAHLVTVIAGVLL